MNRTKYRAECACGWSSRPSDYPIAAGAARFHAGLARENALTDQFAAFEGNHFAHVEAVDA